MLTFILPVCLAANSELVQLKKRKDESAKMRQETAKSKIAYNNVAFSAEEVSKPVKKSRARAAKDRKKKLFAKRRRIAAEAETLIAGSTKDEASLKIQKEHRLSEARERSTLRSGEIGACFDSTVHEGGVRGNAEAAVMQEEEIMQKPIRKRKIDFFLSTVENSAHMSGNGGAAQGKRAKIV